VLASFLIQSDLCIVHFNISHALLPLSSVLFGRLALPRAPVRVQKNCRVGPQSCQAQASFWGPCYYFAVLGGKKLAFFFMIFKYS